MAERGRAVAAVDLGASSGRVLLGRFSGDSLAVEFVHRFENTPVQLPDGVHWDITGLLRETRRGIEAAGLRAGGELDSVGIDTWGCDYALLDDRGRALGVPYHYRDSRTSDALIASVHKLVSREELYARTGMQTLPFNTVFQLAAEHEGPGVRGAERIALIPDLLAYWLTGNLTNEFTAASTSGLLDARTGAWATDLIARLGLPQAPFAHPLTMPGELIGGILSAHDEGGLAAGTPVHAVGGHDTASAFAAAPVSGPGCAILSSGTWSLLGVETDQPILTAEAQEFNFTNERGVSGNVRLLRNIMGLWLMQECQRAWAGSQGRPSFGELDELARGVDGDVPLFDPDHPDLLRPGRDMPARIAALWAGGGVGAGGAGSGAGTGPGGAGTGAGASPEAPPVERAVLVRSILLSLACKYRLVLERIEALTGRRIEVISVVGGGVQDELLCRLTADICGRQVLAGPAEATALGNALVQVLALGEVDDFAQLRELAARSTQPAVYEPALDARRDEIYGEFLAVTGLTPPIAKSQTACV